MQAVLNVKQLSVHFKKIAALKQVSFDLSPGSITGLIGQNGAGKSTLLDCISRLCHPSTGSIDFAGQSLLNKPAYSLAKLGIARTFQQCSLFNKMTVIDNILMGLHSQTKSSFIASAFRMPRVIREEKNSFAKARALLEEADLIKIENEISENLPIPIQKRIELLRALISQPKLLLLDEPASGLTPADKQGLKNWLCYLRDQQQITILMIEHSIDLIMQISDRIIVLDFGEKIADGTPEEIKINPAVINAYIGKKDI